MKLACLLCAGLLLAGCATSRIEVTETGVRPDLAASAGVKIAAAADAPARALAPVVDQLRQAGVAERGDARQGYLLEVSYSERATPVGAYAGAPPTDAQSGWVAAPGKRRWWVSAKSQLCTLAVRVTDAAAGQPTYSVRASAQGKGTDCGRPPADLAAAIAARLSAPPKAPEAG